MGTSNEKGKLKAFLWYSPSCLNYYFSYSHLFLSFCWGSSWWIGRTSVRFSNSWDHYTITGVAEADTCAITLSLHLLSCPCYAHIHDLLRQCDVKQGAFPWRRLMLHTAMPGIFVNGLWLEIPERLLDTGHALLIFLPTIEVSAQNLTTSYHDISGRR